MSHQEHVPWRQVRLEGLIATLPRQILKTGALTAINRDAFDMQVNAQCFACDTAIRFPVIGMGAQSVIDMNGAQDTTFTMAQGSVAGMEKDCGIQPSAEGHREPAVGWKPGKLFSQ
jgi:hypothetical protein